MSESVKQWSLPAVGVVEVGEEKNSADEESDQHKSSIDFM